MKLILPFTPHLANETLDLLNCKTKNTWPAIQANFSEQIKFVVQINGKTREVIKLKKDLDESEINKITSDNSKIKKILNGKKIIKTIFIKNKIINYLIR